MTSSSEEKIFFSEISSNNTLLWIRHISLCDNIIVRNIYRFYFGPWFHTADKHFTILCTFNFSYYRQRRVYKKYGYITRPTRVQGHYYFSVTRKLGQFRIVVFIEYVNI